jgi:hypothetical protein
MTIQLAQAYNLTPGTNRSLSQRFGTISFISATLPDFFKWAKAIGLSDAQILTVDEFSACHNDAVWSGHGYYPGSGFIAGQQCNSRVNIEWPDGSWAIRMPLLACHGTYRGQGNSVYRDATGFSYSTEIRPDHATWVGIPGLGRHSIVSTNYGQGPEGYYVEGMRVTNVALAGGQPIGQRSTAFESSGIFITNGGSCAQIDRVRADGFNDAGIHVVSAIPLRIEHCRTFRNNRAGLLLEGCALSSVVVDQLEGDDNVTLIETAAGRNGQAAGLKSGTFSIKTENGKNTTRPQVGLHLRGQFGITVNDWSAAYYNNVQPGEVVFWDTTNANSYLHCVNYCDAGTTLGGGPQTLVRTRTETFAKPINSDAFGFAVKSGKLMSNQR